MKTSKRFKVAKASVMVGLCLVGAGIGVMGCQNTAEGVGADAKNDTSAVGNAAGKVAEATKAGVDSAVDTTKDATKNAADATTLTPKVKAAIIGNPTLNNPKNLVNVDSKNNTVYLKGHVVDNASKKLAGEVASKAVAESGSKDTVANQLTVQSH